MGRTEEKNARSSSREDNSGKIRGNKEGIREGDRMKRTEWTKRCLTGALAGVVIMTSMPADIYAASVKGVRTEEIIEEVIYEDVGSASGKASGGEGIDESIIVETA